MTALDEIWLIMDSMHDDATKLTLVNLILGKHQGLDDYSNEAFIRGSDFTTDGIVRHFNLLINEAKEGKELSGVVPHKGLQELRETIHAKFKLRNQIPT